MIERGENSIGAFVGLAAGNFVSVREEEEARVGLDELSECGPDLYVGVCKAWDVGSETGGVESGAEGFEAIVGYFDLYYEDLKHCN